MPKVLIADDNAELLGLLTRVFEEAGYVVVPVQRGKMALEKARIEKPDLAVVDVLLPDVMGYDVAALLRSLKVPFLMVSGVFKGGRHGLDAVQRYGAADYFEKPFEMARLVERAAQIAPPPARAAPLEDDEEVDILEEIDLQDVDSDEPALDLTGRVSVTDSPRRISATLSGEAIHVRPVQREVVTRPAAAVVSSEQRPPSSPAPARPRPPAPMSPPTVAAPTAARTDAPQQTPSIELGKKIGVLKDNLPQLISAFYLSGETGELVLQRGQVRKSVYFESGTPVFAASNLSSDRFGQFLVRTGKVPQDELKAATVVADHTKRRTGDVLIEMGLLNDTERMYYVGQQVKAIIYSLFAWEDGTFQLTFKNRARRETLKLDLHPANLILRGVKKLYSVDRLSRLLPDVAKPIPSQDPSYLLSDVELDPWEGNLLARIDGTRAVNALAELAKKPAPQVRGFLVGLLSLRILEIGE